MNLEHSIEALLFWKGEPLSFREILKSLRSANTSASANGTTSEEITEDRVHEALAELAGNLKGRGIILMANEGQEYMLGTSTEASSLIEKLTKEELNKDLGKASLETLSIILYQGPVKRSEIDYVRGVNSTFILRNLLIRGLIEKKPAPDDARTSIYIPSFKLLSYLGVSEISKLPNFEAVKQEIEKFRNEAEPEFKPKTSSQNDTSEDDTINTHEDTEMDDTNLDENIGKDDFDEEEATENLTTNSQTINPNE